MSGGMPVVLAGEVRRSEHGGEYSKADVAKHVRYR
jgi:hypothetical protein